MEGGRCYHRSPVWERSHRGLVRRFAKPLSGVTCFEGSNPSLSAMRAPVAQWIEHLVADQKVVSSSLAGRATLFGSFVGGSGRPLLPIKCLGSLRQRVPRGRERSQPSRAVPYGSPPGGALPARTHPRNTRLQGQCPPVLAIDLNSRAASLARVPGPASCQRRQQSRRSILVRTALHDAHWASCNAVAPEWSGVTVAAFDTTLGRVRALGLLPSSSDQWPGQADTDPAIVCYVDGFVPKAPPGGDPYDRAMVVIVRDRAELVSQATETLYRAGALNRPQRNQKGWRARRDSNPRPLGPQPNALSTELRAHDWRRGRDSNPRSRLPHLAV